MKQELRDIAVEIATKTAPAGGMSIWSAHFWASVNWTAVGTGVLVLLQIVYLIRKWWREETEWGLKLRRWAERHHITRPVDLDD